MSEIAQIGMPLNYCLVFSCSSLGCCVLAFEHMLLMTSGFCLRLQLPLREMHQIVLFFTLSTLFVLLRFWSKDSLFDKQAFNLFDRQTINSMKGVLALALQREFPAFEGKFLECEGKFKRNSAMTHSCLFADRLLPLLRSAFARIQGIS